MRIIFGLMCTLMMASQAYSYDCVKHPWFMGKAWLGIWTAAEAPAFDLVWSDDEQSIAGFYETFEHRSYIGDAPAVRRKKCFQLFSQNLETGIKTKIGEYQAFDITGRIYWMSQEGYFLISGFENDTYLERVYYQVFTDGSQRKITGLPHTSFDSHLVPSPDGRFLANFDTGYFYDDNGNIIKKDVLVVIYDSKTLAEVNRFQDLQGTEFQNYQWHTDGYLHAVYGEDFSTHLAIYPNGLTEDTSAKFCDGPMTSSSPINSKKEILNWDTNGLDILILNSPYENSFGCP